MQGPPGTYQAKRASIHVTVRMRASINNPGADPGFFLGGGALVSCSSSTPINHIVFFCRIPVVLENRRSSQGGVRTPCTLPLDPPLQPLTTKRPNKASSKSTFWRGNFYVFLLYSRFIHLKVTFIHTMLTVYKLPRGTSRSVAWRRW